MGKVIGILALVMLVYYWLHTQKLKSIAIRAAQKRCDQAGVQFLDFSVIHSKLKFCRDSRGRLRVKRQYWFEFTSTGEHRYQGQVNLLGHQVESVDLETFTIN